MILSGVTALLLAPFMVNHLVGGRFALAGYIAIAQGVLVVNTLVMRTGRNAPIPFWAMVISFIVAICGSIALQGVNSIFWAYPTIFICFFLLQRRVALLLSVALLLATTTVVALTVQPSVALRVFATLALTLVMINVVLNVIGELQRALVEQAITDPLTGAFNRRHLDTQLTQLATPGREPRSQNALLALDIDHFKQINDRLGHSAGDEVLKRLVETIGARKRRGDMLFRTGGEEFVLLLPGSSAVDSLRVADEACDSSSKRAICSLAITSRSASVWRCNNPPRPRRSGCTPPMGRFTPRSGPGAIACRWRPVRHRAPPPCPSKPPEWGVHCRAACRSRSACGLRHAAHHALHQPVHAGDGGIVKRAAREPDLALVVDQRRRKGQQAAGLDVGSRAPRPACARPRAPTQRSPADPPGPPSCHPTPAAPASAPRAPTEPRACSSAPHWWVMAASCA